MDDSEILHRISRLVDEEHALYQRGVDDHGLTQAEEGRLHGLEVALDQCWDLLQQRRARREFGRDPNRAHVRDAGTVEGYDPEWKPEQGEEGPRNPG